MGAARLSPNGLTRAGVTRLSPTPLAGDPREVALSLGTHAGDSDAESEGVRASATSPLGHISAVPPQSGPPDPKNLTAGTPRPPALYWCGDNK